MVSNETCRKKRRLYRKTNSLRYCIDVLAAQPMIGAEPPTLHQREDSMNPGQDHMAGHLSDRPRVVSVIEKAVVGPGREFGLVDLNHALQRLALRIDHRLPELLRQRSGGLVRDAELGLELDCRHAIR